MQIQEFKKRLNGFFNDSGMSKNALAKVTKISQSQVSNLANGKSKRWTKNTKKIDDFIQEYYQDNFKIPVKIEQILKQILIKSPENKAQILTILEAINALKPGSKNGKK